MHRFLIRLFLLAAALAAHAQCDSTPPLLQAAFTMYGDYPNERFGQWMYVIHDTNGNPQLVIAALDGSGQRLKMRVYSKFASATDTAYRCCLPYAEAHECHVTGSKYPDYVVHQLIGGSPDTVFLIPGTPEGIWSQKRQPLMSDAGGATNDKIIIAKRFDGSSRDMIVIGNWRAKVSLGSISIWHGADSLSMTPDTVMYGDNQETATSFLGLEIGETDLNHDAIPDLIVQSGNDDGTTRRHEMKVFWGGPDFPHQVTRWRDRQDDNGWWYENGAPLSLADVNRDGQPDLNVLTYVRHDTVWGASQQADRSFAYRASSPFDTDEVLRWRALDVPSQVCTPYLRGFGSPVVNVGDVNGDGQPDLTVGAVHSFGDFGAVVLYLGGSAFDTIPDAYYWPADVWTTAPAGAYEVVGGFDFNHDGLMDFAVPMPFATGGGSGNQDNPYGAVSFVAGSRSLRSIGATGVREAALPRLPSIIVYPRPARDLAHVLVTGAGSGAFEEVQIIDMLGRVVRTLTPINGEMDIRLDGFPAGMYHVVARSSSHTITNTIIHIL